MSKYLITIKPEGTGKFITEGGDKIERVVMDINGKDVQVIRHDGDDKHAFVFVGEKLAFIHESKAGTYIENELDERENT